MCNYQLEKSIFSEKDFDTMGWHDNTIWSMLADPDSFEYSFDIDYIFKWVNPKNDEDSFKFWVSPVTLVFENIHSVQIDIKSSQGNIEILELLMEELQLTPNGKFTEHNFRFECEEGFISLNATNFKMYVRQKPKLLERQCLTIDERCGISFSKKLKEI